MNLLTLFADTGSSAPAGPTPYLYYQINVSAWQPSGAGYGGAGEIALYDDVANLGNLGTANGQLNIHPTTGTATADNYELAPAIDAADGDASDPWLTSAFGAGLATYWRFQFDSLPTNGVVAYTIWSANSQYRVPYSWTLEGSNDGTNWTVLDTRAEQTGWTSTYQPQNFTIGA